jgi:CDP-diacylglycerol--serine O-phosphatidyltransferase
MSDARAALRSRLRKARRRPRYTGPSFNRLVPNILTMLGLCCGLTAIRFALDGRWEKAAALIVVAAVYVLINLAVDLIYALADPRVRAG